MAKLLLINGPNLNLLGLREPETYGRTTLPDIELSSKKLATSLGHELDCFQSNHEGGIVDRIQAIRQDGTAFVIINPGAYTKIYGPYKIPYGYTYNPIDFLSAQ